VDGTLGMWKTWDPCFFVPPISGKISVAGFQFYRKMWPAEICCWPPPVRIDRIPVLAQVSIIFVKHVETVIHVRYCGCVASWWSYCCYFCACVPREMEYDQKHAFLCVVLAHHEKWLNKRILSLDSPIWKNNYSTTERGADDIWFSRQLYSYLIQELFGRLVHGDHDILDVRIGTSGRATRDGSGRNELHLQSKISGTQGIQPTAGSYTTNRQRTQMPHYQFTTPPGKRHTNCRHQQTSFSAPPFDVSHCKRNVIIQKEIIIRTCRWCFASNVSTLFAPPHWDAASLDAWFWMDEYITTNVNCNLYKFFIINLKFRRWLLCCPVGNPHFHKLSHRHKSEPIMKQTAFQFFTRQKCCWLFWWLRLGLGCCSCLLLAIAALCLTCVWALASCPAYSEICWLYSFRFWLLSDSFEVSLLKDILTKRRIIPRYLNLNKPDRPCFLFVPCTQNIGPKRSHLISRQTNMCVPIHKGKGNIRWFGTEGINRRETSWDLEETDTCVWESGWSCTDLYRRNPEMTRWSLACTAPDPMLLFLAMWTKK